MSVQQAGVEILNAFGSRLVTIGFRKQCDQWYSASASRVLNHGDIFTNAEKIVKHICDMNALNYEKRYNEKCESLADFVKIGNTNINVYQFLKLLQYILYNTFDYKEYFNKEQLKVEVFLRELEQDILQNIVNEIPEYKAAKWGRI